MYHLDCEAEPSERTALEAVVDHIKAEIKRLESMVGQGARAVEGLAERAHGRVGGRGRWGWEERAHGRSGGRGSVACVGAGRVVGGESGGAERVLEVVAWQR